MKYLLSLPTNFHSSSKGLLLLLSLGLFPFISFAQSKKVIKKEVNEFRAHHKADFLKEERSPFYNKKEDLAKLKFYKPKKKFRVESTFTRAKNVEPFQMPTYSGKLKEFVKYGTLTFTLKGKTHQLAVYQNLKTIRIPGYKDYLFLPFKDYTNDQSTYGGGRYIDMKIADLEGDKVILDFNKCYNPWCAYSDSFNCPIPPIENHLAIKIKAGEKQFAKH